MGASYRQKLGRVRNGCIPMHCSAAVVTVGWKLIFFIVLTFLGRKINLSQISPAKSSRSGPNSVYVDTSRGDNVQVILGTIGPFWAKWGLGQILRSARFLCVVIQTTVQQLCNGWFSPNLTTKRNSVFRRWIRKDSFEEVHFRGHLPPKSEIESRSNRHLTQSRLQVTGCTAERYCLLHVVVQGPGSFRGPVNFFVRRTEVYSGDQPTAHWNRRMIPIFPCGGRQSIWVLPTAEFSCDLW